MASKHFGAFLSKASISSSVMQTAQQVESKFPPLFSALPAVLPKDLQDALEDSVRRIEKEISEIIENKFRKLREDIASVLQKFADHIDRLDQRIDVAVENSEKLEDKIENKVEIIQDEITMLQYRSMEFALRIRGMQENNQEDLRQVVAKDIALILESEPEEILREIEKVFRVNSRVARQRNLPRDVVIYFFSRSLRNKILQAFYKQRFQIAAQDVILLKELPSRILKVRKHFAFLADELKRRQICFRWEIPAGMVMNYAGTRYRLDTILKAKDFYTSVLKAGSLLPTAEILEEKLEEKSIQDMQVKPLQQSFLTEDSLIKLSTCGAFRSKVKVEEKLEEQLTGKNMQVEPLHQSSLTEDSSKKLGMTRVAFRTEVLEEKLEQQPIEDSQVKPLQQSFLTEDSLMKLSICGPFRSKIKVEEKPEEQLIEEDMEVVPLQQSSSTEDLSKKLGMTRAVFRSKIMEQQKVFRHLPSNR